MKASQSNLNENHLREVLVELCEWDAQQGYNEAPVWNEVRKMRDQLIDKSREALEKVVVSAAELTEVKKVNEDEDEDEDDFFEE